MVDLSHQARGGFDWPAPIAETRATPKPTDAYGLP